MNKVFFHSKNNEQKNLQFYYYLLIIFIISGIYKNGFLLYRLNLISLINIFKPFILSIISVVISIIFSFIFKEKIKSYRFINNLLISLIVMPNISYVYYVILLVIVNIIYSFYHFNMPSFYMLILSTFLLFMHKYTYLNAFESTNNLNYNFWDYLFGKGFGGISNTFLLATIIISIILICRSEYKKSLLLSFLSVYYIILFISLFITKNLAITNIINNNVLFASVFIAPLSLYSPYTKGGCYLYGALLAIIVFAFSFWHIEIGLYLGISLLSIFKKFLDRLFVR